MDRDGQRRRPVEKSGFTSQEAKYQHVGAAQGSSRPRTITTLPTFNTGHGAAYSNNYGFGEVQRPMEQSTQSAGEQQSVEYTRQLTSAQSQFYQPSGQGMGYGVPQPQQSYNYSWYGPVPPSAQQRHYRDPVSGQLGVAQPYLMPAGSTSSDSSSMNATTQPLAPQLAQYYNVEQQQHSFGSLSQTPTIGNASPNSAPPQATMHPPLQPSMTPVDPAAFTLYHKLHRHTLECTRSDFLEEAATGLRKMSEELLGNVQRLGLVYDDALQRDSRLALWHNFNNTWLAVLQRQRDVSEAELRSPAISQPPRSRISRQTLQVMGDELITLCNEIDEWGLVDYELGVWEEQIVDLLEPCVAIATKLDGPPASANGSSNPSAQRAGERAVKATATSRVSAKGAVAGARGGEASSHHASISASTSASMSASASARSDGRRIRRR